MWYLKLEQAFLFRPHLLWYLMELPFQLKWKSICLAIFCDLTGFFLNFRYLAILFNLLSSALRVWLFYSLCHLFFFTTPTMLHFVHYYSYAISDSVIVLLILLSVWRYSLLHETCPDIYAPLSRLVASLLCRRLAQLLSSAPKYFMLLYFLLSKVPAFLCFLAYKLYISVLKKLKHESL